MGGRDHVRPSGVNPGMDCEGGGVDRPVAVNNLTAVVDEDEVLHPDELEVHAERVDPEVVEPLRISSGDVAGEALVESEMSEQAKSRGEALVPVPGIRSELLW